MKMRTYSNSDNYSGKEVKIDINGKYIIINPKDNVAIALQDLKKGEMLSINENSLTLKKNIPNRHKFAIKSILRGEPAIKYGYSIGTVLNDIVPGDGVHIEELKTSLNGLTDYLYEPLSAPINESTFKPSFMGYVRQNGEVGVRNEIWIINTVGCVNNTAQILEKQASQQFKFKVDGIYAFPHLYGCSQLGNDLLSTQKILAGMVNHPNVGGVLVLSLGCENNSVDAFKKILGEFDPQRVKFLVSQQVENEIEEGLKLIGELVEHVSTYKKEKVNISKLKIGLKCGASDGFSGISANPLVGSFSDILTSCGGTVVLTEISEMFGAESILMNRCVSSNVFKKTVNTNSCLKSK